MRNAMLTPVLQSHISHRAVGLRTHCANNAATRSEPRYARQVRRPAAQSGVVLSLAAAILWCAPAAPAAEAKAEEAVIIIFPFTASEGGAAAGSSFTDSLNLRAKRLGLVVVDPLSFREAMAGAPAVTLATPPAEVVKILKERFSARYGLWGSVKPEGAGLSMEVRGVDAQAGEKPVVSGVFSAAEKQLVNPVQDNLLMELTGRKKKPVPEATPEADAKVPTIGPELVKNGGFEAGTKSPDNWQRIDGLTTFWPAEGHTGKGLKVVTDVYEKEWVEWQKQYKAGATADKAPKAAQTSGAKYDTAAGNYGIAYDNDPIPVVPGKSYKISISYKGTGDNFFFPKLFIRGWAKVGDEDRVVYDAYLALRCATGGKAWESNVRIIDVPMPKDKEPPIKFIKLKIYAYWPPGTFYFDDVSMKECEPQPAKK